MTYKAETDLSCRGSMVLIVVLNKECAQKHSFVIVSMRKWLALMGNGSRFFPDHFAPVPVIDHVKERNCGAGEMDAIARHWTYC